MLVDMSRVLADKCIALSEQSQRLIDEARELRSTAKGQVLDAQELVALLRLRAGRRVAGAI